MNSKLFSIIKAELFRVKGYVYAFAVLYLMIPLMYYVSDDLDVADMTGFEMPSFAIVIFIIAQAVGVLMCTELFNDCHKPETADVTLSLPVSSGSRFSARFCMIIAFTVIPYIISMLGTLFIMLVFSPVINVSAAVSEWFSCFIVMLVCVIFVDATALICSVFTSSHMGALTVSFISIAAVTAFPIALYRVVMQCAHVSTSGTMPAYVSCIGAGETYSFLFRLEDWNKYTPSALLLTGCVNIIISAAVVFLAYRVYCSRSRKSIFSFPPAAVFFMAVIFVCTAVFASAMLFEKGFWGVSVGCIAGIAVYIAVLVFKGFNKRFIIKRAAVFSVLCAALGAAVIAAALTECFGISCLPVDKADKDYKVSISSEKEYFEDNVLSESTDDGESLVKTADILKRYEDKSGRELSFGDMLFLSPDHYNDTEPGYTKVYLTVRENNADEAKRSLVKRWYCIKNEDIENMLTELKEVQGK
ncbi:ABC transporter permease [Ruminococcus sp. NK3A76]|uniref:ABC transporter permease n=1 Tax=Ruminococcus sp. NK3A76 TaxID=877411 RepID=UPI00048FFA54|nr:ABC transporter permease [Ruminococcus sp. NK3A76]